MVLVLLVLRSKVLGLCTRLPTDCTNISIIALLITYIDYGQPEFGKRLVMVCINYEASLLQG
jgi:hypothetical protein